MVCIVVFHACVPNISNISNRIKNEIEHFVDIATYNYQLSAETIYNDHIDVLYDLQCHTRGNRVEIVAVRPSPIIVNFLIYPGAMGKCDVWPFGAFGGFGERRTKTDTGVLNFFFCVVVCRCALDRLFDR